MNLHKWTTDCTTCGAVDSWAAVQPTECPNDGGHTVNSVGLTAPGSGVVVGTGHAIQGFCMHDGAGRVFDVTIDANGVLQTTQVYGPAPS